MRKIVIVKQVVTAAEIANKKSGLKKVLMPLFKKSDIKEGKILKIPVTKDLEVWYLADERHNQKSYELIKFKPTTKIFNCKVVDTSSDFRISVKSVKTGNTYYIDWSQLVKTEKTKVSGPEDLEYTDLQKKVLKEIIGKIKGFKIVKVQSDVHATWYFGGNLRGDTAEYRAGNIDLEKIDKICSSILKKNKYNFTRESVKGSNIYKSKIDNSEISLNTLNIKGYSGIFAVGVYK